MFCTVVESLEQADSWVFNVSNCKNNTHLNIYILINFIHLLTNIYRMPLSDINLGIWDISKSETKSLSIVKFTF